jgi:hypothetical protein
MKLAYLPNGIVQGMTVTVPGARQMAVFIHTYKNV